MSDLGDDVLEDLLIRFLEIQAEQDPARKLAEMERLLEDPATKLPIVVGQNGVGIDLHTALAAYKSGEPIVTSKEELDTQINALIQRIFG